MTFFTSKLMTEKKLHTTQKVPESQTQNSTNDDVVVFF